MFRNLIIVLLTNITVYHAEVVELISSGCERAARFQITTEGT
jgi:hypothetical protein